MYRCVRGRERETERENQEPLDVRDWSLGVLQGIPVVRSLFPQVDWKAAHSSSSGTCRVLLQGAEIYTLGLDELREVRAFAVYTCSEFRRHEARQPHKGLHLCGLMDPRRFERARACRSCCLVGECSETLDSGSVGGVVLTTRSIHGKKTRNGCSVAVVLVFASPYLSCGLDNTRGHTFISNGSVLRSGGSSMVGLTKTTRSKKR